MHLSDIPSELRQLVHDHFRSYLCRPCTPEMKQHIEADLAVFNYDMEHGAYGEAARGLVLTVDWQNPMVIELIFRPRMTDKHLSEGFSEKLGTPLDIQTMDAVDENVDRQVRAVLAQLKRSDHVRLFGDERRMYMTAQRLDAQGCRVRLIKMKYGWQVIVQRADDLRSIGDSTPPVAWSPP